MSIPRVTTAAALRMPAIHSTPRATRKLAGSLPSHGVSAQTYARWMTRLVALLRYIRVIG